MFSGSYKIDLELIVEKYKLVLPHNLKNRIILLLENLSQNDQLWSNHKLSLIQAQ